VLQAIRDGDGEQAIGSAKTLRGLGPGLTPSGDDLLVGLSAALWKMTHPLAEFFACGCAAGARLATTHVAASYLSYAARGEFAESLHAVLDAIVGGDDRGVDDCVTQLTSWGATSGVDCLVGILFGLRAGLAGGEA
jgi:hypothetical protein